MVAVEERLGQKFGLGVGLISVWIKMLGQDFWSMCCVTNAVQAGGGRASGGWGRGKDVRGQKLYEPGGNNVLGMYFVSSEVDCTFFG